MTALADTGCQAVCMGPEQLSRTGLSVKDLMEVDLRLSGANVSSIRILGGVFITITGEDSSGKKWSTKQLCYVAKGVNRLMLSKQACVQLGIVNSSFPAATTQPHPSQPLRNTINHTLHVRHFLMHRT